MLNWINKNHIESICSLSQSNFNFFIELNAVSQKWYRKDKTSRSCRWNKSRFSRFHNHENTRKSRCENTTCNAIARNISKLSRIALFSKTRSHSTKHLFFCHWDSHFLSLLICNNELHTWWKLIENITSFIAKRCQSFFLFSTLFHYCHWIVSFALLFIFFTNEIWISKIRTQLLLRWI